MAILILPPYSPTGATAYVPSDQIIRWQPLPCGQGSEVVLANGDRLRTSVKPEKLAALFEKGTL